MNFRSKTEPQRIPSLRDRIQLMVQSIKKVGVHSVCHMAAAGFQYIGNGDTARCKDCGLEASNWTLDMNPFTIHSQRRPDCPFVCSVLTSSLSNPSKSTASTVKTSTSEEPENQCKRRKIGTGASKSISHTLIEADSLQQVRRRTFSHWPHRTIPFSAQMIQAGFFNCNVGDRVICIYCNLICQQWTPHTDDPCDVHKTLSPNCPYVKSKLMHPAISSINIDDESSTQSNNIFRVPCHAVYSEIPKRYESFINWPNRDAPSIDDLVRAGFFYTGSNNSVTCFHCNGSLQNLRLNDNPTIEHARWFPHCTYAKQLCGDHLYRKIQEYKRAQQERSRSNQVNERTDFIDMSNTNLRTNSEQLLIPDESTLSRHVAARLDLPISQRLLQQNFKLSIVKRCWEDQLRLKRDNFVSEYDLYVACLILQKQITHIDGKKENIVIPSLRMKQIRSKAEVQREGSDGTTSPARDTDQSSSIHVSNDTAHESATSSSQSSSRLRLQSNANENQEEIKATPTNNDATQTQVSEVAIPCMICSIKEKQLACLPCGHLVSCVSCSESLRLCPRCHQKIVAYVRIYV